MPSKNPRLTLTLDHEIAFLLRRLSELTGESQAALVSELLQGNRLAFLRLIGSLEAVASHRADLVGQFAHDLGRSQDLIEAKIDYLMEEQNEKIVRSIDDRTMQLPLEDGIKRRKGRVAPGAGREHAGGGPRSAGGSSGARSGTKPGASSSSSRSGTPTY